MKYDVNQFIILTAQPDCGIWDDIVVEIADTQSGMYRIRPFVNPKNKTYILKEILHGHLFSDMWVYHGKSRLLNTLLERS